MLPGGRMPLFAHILFPVDFSRRCEAFAPVVRALALRNTARITLFHAFELPIWEFAVDEFQASADSAMEQFALRHFDGMPAQSVTKLVHCAPTVTSIVEYVHRKSIDLD